MRLALAGGIPHARLLAIDLEDGDVFKPRDFEEYGYNRFDVVCVGGGGGNGGSWHNTFTDPEVWGMQPFRALGGAGGGGGLHRVSGPLQSLPDECAVVVGQGGAPGATGVATGDVTNGDHGTISRFNYHTCYASGGKGGHGPSFPYSGGVFSPDEIFPSGAHGGEGGLGNREDPGGGGPGGSTNPSDSGSGTWETDVPTPGYWGAEYNPTTGVGSGGGGGVGGVGRAGRIWRPATEGGAGCVVMPSDPDLLGSPGGYPSKDRLITGEKILPGGAGGASLTGLLSLAKQAGRSFAETVQGEDGAVVIVLTME